VFDIEIKMDHEWRRLMGRRELARESMAVGLHHAAIAVNQAVNRNFRTRGTSTGFGQWKSLSRAYRQRKMAGRVAPGRQLPSTAGGQADLMLTGALRTAAVFRPIIQYGLNEVVVRVNTGFGGVGRYAGRANYERPYFLVPKGQIIKVTRAFMRGFRGALRGEPDVTGWLTLSGGMEG
jgi:hypothetical protein